MASTEGLMPITREYLSRFYDNYPFTPLSDDVSRLSSELQAISNNLKEEFPLTEDETVLAHEADCSPPHKIDENMWKNREHIEEIIFLFERSHWPALLQQQSTEENIEIALVLGVLKVQLQNTLKIIEAFQSKNSENIFSTVITYMPQDFRGALIRQQRERSERYKQAEIDALVNSGGKIRDRYALLWNQQMERRRQLAQLGSATGVFKTLVKYLVGVPQVLLDFIRQINDDHGPMEEQRQRYGPSLYNLTTMVLSIRLFISLTWERFEAKTLDKDRVIILEKAVNVYTSEMERFIIFISVFIKTQDTKDYVVVNSLQILPSLFQQRMPVLQQGKFNSSAVFTFALVPYLNMFYVKRTCGTDGLFYRNSDDYKETIITPGKTHEVSLVVDAANSYIAWDFSVIQGKMNMDVGFSVEYVNSAGEITMILPYRRYESNQNLRYKVDSIPPVAEAVVEAE
ncbi:hypothetical protein GIB67_042019 [Kingdonia uniflora]|uniref:GOLD domain-containing protein n=1 Tax=Kingdonia uniflora TaxID=39325 RepID=A0A7J7NZS3_9MAGN|nr:hypothetical protein GIB67_042019 [Kingdonia uniflora]